MIVVNGSAMSGVEAVMAAFAKNKRALGAKTLIPSLTMTHNALKEHLDSAIATYEQYLDKFETNSATLEEDLLEVLPDGIWPGIQLNARDIKLVHPGIIAEGMACRLGGSLFLMDPQDIEQVIIVICAPDVLWERRTTFRMAMRPLDAKYKESRTYRALISRLFGEFTTIPDQMTDEVNMIVKYVSEALRKFGDKVEFVDGANPVIEFNMHGIKHSKEQDNLKKLPARAFNMNGPIRSIFDLPEFNPTKEAYKQLEEMVKTKSPIAGVSAMAATTPLDWFCARIQSFVDTQTCIKCLGTAGDVVFEKAVAGWHAEPCAFEVAYGPAPHKTIEESIANHNWGVLP